MPITLKLNLSSSSASQPSTTSVPSIKLKVPTKATHHDNNDSPSTPLAHPSPPTPQPTAGPSTPSLKSSKGSKVRSAKSTPKVASASKGKSTSTPKGSVNGKSKGKGKATPKDAAARPSAIPPRLLSAGPSTPRAQISSLPDTPTSFSSTTAQTPTVELTEWGQEDPLALTASPSSGAASGSQGQNVRALYDRGAGGGHGDQDLDDPEEVGEEIEAEVEDGFEEQPPMVDESDDAMDVIKQEVIEEPVFVKPVVKKAPPKKPLKELLNKVLVELRRRDEYALFDEPVNVDDFPGYLDIIGGEESMMDLGTMQNKVDEGVYRTIEALETDLRMLVAAAQKFNPEGTIPYNSAGKLLTYGLKHIERYRPMVRTPSPSPVRESRAPSGHYNSRAQSMMSGREGTVPIASAADIEPARWIPTEMLDFPANSLAGLAVGWSKTGGKTIWSRRQIRGREKFSGKWRNWALDGTRDMTELEDPEYMLSTMKREREYTSLSKVDWRKTRREQGAWWELEMGGPTGQAPIPFTPLPKPTEMVHRKLGMGDWAGLPEIDAEARLLGAKYDCSETEALANQLRPVPRKQKVTNEFPAPFVNLYDGHLDIQPQETLRQIMYGDTTGEAYSRSLDAFVRGAVESGKRNSEPIKGDPAVSLVKAEEDEGESEEDKLTEWVQTNWRGGLESRQSAVRGRLDEAIRGITRIRAMGRHSSKQQFDGTAISQLDRPYYEAAKMEYERQSLRYLAAPKRQLDIAPLLQKRGDFFATTAHPASSHSERFVQTTKEILALAKDIEEEARKEDEEKPKLEDQSHEGVNGTKRKPEVGEDDAGLRTNVKMLKVEGKGLDSTASSPLTQPPDSPKTKDSTKASTARQERMDQLRFGLIALVKFYPLAALKKMSRQDADRLLPSNVKELMSVPAPKP